MKKDEQPTKKYLQLFINNINRIDLMIFYFLNPQIKYIYQHDKSIGRDYNQIFATVSNPTAIAADSAGNVYVLDTENDKYKSLRLMVHSLKNGTSIS